MKLWLNNKVIKSAQEAKRNDPSHSPEYQFALQNADRVFKLHQLQGALLKRRENGELSKKERKKSSAPK